jgi:protein-disulfide isomerase
MHFRTRLNSRRTENVLYLSPDQRFLSRFLYDTTIAPSNAVIQKQSEEFQAGLSAGDFPMRGDTSAPITILLFTEFQCADCKRQAEVLRDDPVKSEVRILFRNLPLPTHPWSRTAAVLAACIYQQSNSAFWALHDDLFQSQETLTSDNINQFVMDKVVSSPDLSPHKYEMCLETQGSAAQVERDLSFARKYDLRSTPTLFINGTRVTGVVNAAAIRAIAHASRLPNNSSFSFTSP